MLKPDYFTGKEKRILELWQKLEDWILKDIARRILATGQITATADRLIYKLRMMGESRDAISQKLEELTRLSNVELQKVLQEAVLASWEDEKVVYGQMGAEVTPPLENPEVIRIINAEFKKSKGELYNLTRTTLAQSQRDLTDLLDQAELRVSSGVQSYNAAINEVLDQYAGRGVYVTYPTGTRRTIEAAVRCCIFTSMAQTAAEMQNHYIIEAGTNIVIVSAHLGARTGQKGQPPYADHSLWQGGEYSIRGSEPGYPNLKETTGYDIDPETGRGDPGDMLGLLGYNCKHGVQGWSKDLRNPWKDKNGKLIIDTEENRKTYDNTQKARAIERSIRAMKRKLIVKNEEVQFATTAGDTEGALKLQTEYDTLAYKLTNLNKKYNDFCAEHNLQPQYDRNKVADFDRAQAKEANKAAKRYIKDHS
jgi:hypothetical protein